jgi:hypothetical protein
MPNWIEGENGKWDGGRIYLTSDSLKVYCIERRVAGKPMWPGPLDEGSPMSATPPRRVWLARGPGADDTCQQAGDRSRA